MRANTALALDYLVAPPRMAHYIDWSTKIYQVYLKYIASEDIFPYSIDEVFMDATHYPVSYTHLDVYKRQQTMILTSMVWPPTPIR